MKSKNKVINCRSDEELEAVIEEVMAEENMKKSEAIRHMLMAYKTGSNHVSENQKRANAWLINNMYNEIDNIPQEYCKGLLELLGGYKCQI